ncbi:MAG: hypothetical protein GXP10_06725 [Gammaproteobacteria bacterium]|nr:hypothetical protein [Gammaproteobacteria bacterium]
MSFPKPIYEALPFLYFVVGIYTFVKFDSSVAHISAALFCTAGVVVYWWRRSERSYTTHYIRPQRKRSVSRKHSTTVHRSR